MRTCWSIRIVVSVVILSLSVPVFAQGEPSVTPQPEVAVEAAPNGQAPDVVPPVETKPHAKLNCAAFVAAASTKHSKDVTKKDLAVVNKLAAGKSRPWAPGPKFGPWKETGTVFAFWKLTKWPGIYSALVHFESFVMGLRTEDFVPHIESQDLPAGSNKVARNVRQLLDQIEGVKAELARFEADETSLIGQKQEAEEDFRDALRANKPAGEFKELLASREQTKKEIKDLGPKIEEARKSATGVNKTQAVDLESDDPIPMDDEPKAGAPKNPSKLELLEQKKLNLVAKLADIEAKLKPLVSAHNAAVAPKKAAVGGIQASLETIAGRIKRRQATLSEGDRLLDAQAKAFVVQALYTEWQLWDLYQAEKKARADKEEADRKKIADKEKAKQQIADLKKQAVERKAAAELVLSNAKAAAEAATAEKKSAAGGSTPTAEPKAQPKGKTKKGDGDEAIPLAPATPKPPAK